MPKRLSILYQMNCVVEASANYYSLLLIDANNILSGVSNYQQFHYFQFKADHTVAKAHWVNVVVGACSQTHTYTVIPIVISMYPFQHLLQPSTYILLLIRFYWMYKVVLTHFTRQEPMGSNNLYKKIQMKCHFLKVLLPSVFFCHFLFNCNF